MEIGRIVDALRKRRAKEIEAAVAASLVDPERALRILNMVVGLDEAEGVLLNCVRSERERNEDDK